MKIIETENIFTDNPIYFPPEFSDFPEDLPRRIPAKSVLATIPADAQTLEKAVGECHRRLCEIMPPETELKLFCAQNMFFENSAVVRSKNLWKSNELLHDVSNTAKKIGPVRVKNYDNKIRHYAFCSLILKDAFHAFEAIRRLRSCFGLFDDTLDIEDLAAADAYYHVAFPKVEASWVDWPSLIRRLATEKSRLVRVTGTHDDREVSIDVFNW